MALSKLEIDTERAEEIAHRMKEIIETTWLKYPILDRESVKEYQALKRDIQNMGMRVTYKIYLILDEPLKPKVKVELTVWKPENITLQ